MHDAFIKALGGVTEVGRYMGVPAQVVNNWRYRGVAWPYRMQLAVLAQMKHVPLPPEFLSPTWNARRQQGTDTSEIIKTPA